MREEVGVLMEPIVVCQMLLVEEVSNLVVASGTRCETAERLVSFQVEHALLFLVALSVWCAAGRPNASLNQ